MIIEHGESERMSGIRFKNVIRIFSPLIETFRSRTKTTSQAPSSQLEKALTVLLAPPAFRSARLG